MKTVWIVADYIISPLGMSSEENYENIVSGKSGIRRVDHTKFNNSPFSGSVIEGLGETADFTRFEKLVADATRNILSIKDFDRDSALFILSTTKGNVEYLSKIRRYARLSLHASAKHVACQFGFKHFLVVSNACISGVLALGTAQRFLASGKYQHALVIGAEVLSPFIVSGFQSLHALSAEPCAPFDKNRSGISLGEGTGAVLLTTKPEEFLTKHQVAITGVGLSNDANHISGPSRTGKELAMAIKHALHSANLQTKDIDSISAHGTATVFNDEMEAKAFAAAGMESTPINSLKGYYGHTLGAAGVIETIICKHALLNNKIIGTKGFETLGVSQPLNVVKHTFEKPQKRILKTASGFGGCNAALVLEKSN